MKKIRFGVIGTSAIVDKVLKGGFCDERFEFTAVYSRNQDTGDTFASKYGVQHVFTSLEEMVSSDVIDAVYVASPNSFHAAHSITAMEHKKHVLCEKPFATNSQQVRDMIECAKKSGVTLMEAINPTLTPNFLAAKDAISKIGTVKKYFASYTSFSSRYENYRNGIIENAFKPEFSNGAIMDIGIYTIYPMVVLFGKPISIQSTGTMLESGVDAEGAAIFKYDGFSANVIFSKVCSSSIPTEIQGEDGTVVIDKISLINNVTLVDRVTGKNSDISRETMDCVYYYEIKEFIDLIEQGKQESEVNSWKNSLTVMEIISGIRDNIWNQ